MILRLALVSSVSLLAGCLFFPNESCHSQTTTFCQSLNLATFCSSHTGACSMSGGVTVDPGQGGSKKDSGGLFLNVAPGDVVTISTEKFPRWTSAAAPLLHVSLQLGLHVRIVGAVATCKTNSSSDGYGIDCELPAGATAIEIEVDDDSFGAPSSGQTFNVVATIEEFTCTGEAEEQVCAL